MREVWRTIRCTHSSLFTVPRVAAFVAGAMALALACAALKSPDDRPAPADAATESSDAPADDAGPGDARCPHIIEYPLPNTAPSAVGKAPAGIALGPDGNLWFALQSTLALPLNNFGNGVGQLTAGGVATEFAVGGPLGPIAIAGDDAGNLWLAQNEGNILRLTPRNGQSPQVTEVPIGAGVPVPNGVVAGPDGNIWFTEYAGNAVGRIDSTTLAVDTFPIGTSGAHPRAIVRGPDGNLWFAEQIGGVGQITPSGEIREFRIGNGNPAVTGIAVGVDGNLWFTDMGDGEIWHVAPDGGGMTPARVPNPGNNYPYDIALGPDGNLWFTELQAIGRITPDGRILECPTPTRMSMPGGITVGPNGTLFFTEKSVNQVGVLSVQ
jgi:streptogramin lyase